MLKMICKLYLCGCVFNIAGGVMRNGWRVVMCTGLGSDRDEPGTGDLPVDS